MNLRSSLVRLAYEKPELRDELLPLIHEARISGPPDSRFRPPRGIAAAVHDGKLPPECLLAWKMVVEKLGDHFDYGGATAYWRNKCQKGRPQGFGITLPEEFIEGMGGKGVAKQMSLAGIKNGDQIEEWVKAKMKSEGLITAVGRSALEAEIMIGSLEGKIEEAEALVAKHAKEVEAGRGGERRKKWLAGAEKKLKALQKEVKSVQDSVQAVTAAAARHESHTEPTITFEEKFQTLLREALRELSHQEVLTKVLAGINDFNAAMAQMEHVESVAEGARVAFGWSDLTRMLSGAWRAIQSAAASVASWVRSLNSTTKDLNKLLDQAGAAKA